MPVSAPLMPESHGLVFVARGHSLLYHGKVPGHGQQMLTQPKLFGNSIFASGDFRAAFDWGYQ